ncbi:GNAT family N-acetyltransferase [Catellatospora sp. NPDC049609]|uniref:GNAT family N-acetyltransferase n=1 Tax=Catellatospora sp. NPDC049609 TaxID=3155505 RepID=UPI0034445A91
MLNPLRTGDLFPGSPVLAQLAALYAGNADYHRLSGDFGARPEEVSPGQVAAALDAELAEPGVEVLLARDPEAGDGAPLAGVAVVLRSHPADGLPWIGLLLVDARRQGRGLGRAVAEEVHERLRRHGSPAVRLAVLENNPAGLAFWTALGYAEIDRRPDRQAGRDCVVMHRPL